MPGRISKCSSPSSVRAAQIRSASSAAANSTPSDTAGAIRFGAERHAEMTDEHVRDDKLSGL
jgi:hypothetical protein